VLEGDHDLNLVIGSPLPPMVTAMAPVSLTVTIQDDEAVPGCKI